MIKIDSDAINQLKIIPWFQNCGEPPQPLHLPIRQLNDWCEVRKAAADPDWICITEEAQGNLTEYLSKYHPNDFHGVWNKIVREVRPQVDKTAATAAETISTKHNLGPEFVNAVKWDILNGLMEVTYESKSPPIFFGKLLEIYRAGHYPCGIEKDRTIIFY